MLLICEALLAQLRVKALPALRVLNDRRRLFDRDAMRGLHAVIMLFVFRFSGDRLPVLLLPCADDVSILKHLVSSVLLVGPALKFGDLRRSLRALIDLPALGYLVRPLCLDIDPVHHDMNVRVVRVDMRTPDHLQVLHAHVLRPDLDRLLHLFGRRKFILSP